jgi:alpha-L-rhamnosidase
MNQHSHLQSTRTLATRTLLASLLTSIVFALVLAPACSAQTAAKPAAQKPSASVAQTGAPSIAALRAGFANPPNEARPMVRWWWFGLAVVKPEILRELQQMKADGIQGAELAFEYPQVLDDPAKGLKNLPFLSPEMLDDVAYAQAEGRKLGLRIDLTLCSGWPYGGPATTLAEAVTRIRVAQVAVPAGASSVAVPSLAEGESLIAADITEIVATPAVPAAAPAGGPVRGPGGAFAGRGGRNAGPPPPAYDATSAKPLAVTGSSAAVTPSDKPRTALFFILGHTKQQVKRAAVGAEGYVLDPFSHVAVANYLKDVGEPLIGAFGSTPPYAIFSDSLEAYGADWTPNLPAEFQKRRGYDLIPHLPELAAGGSVAADTVRHDYGQTLTELIDENYLSQMTAWAVAHHTKFRSQTYGEPAVDFSSQNLASLAEGEGPQWRAFSTLRWATSANHVYNHVVTSGETFTWLHSPVFRAIPLDMKTEADIDFIMGENQIICHGWGYSAPPGEVPEPGWSLYAAASFNNHNPWHPVMPAVTAYIGRMSYLMRQGKPANQVAILLPTDDAWATFAPGRSTVTGVMGRYVTPAMMSAILSAGYNVDYIDAKAIDKVGVGAHQVLILPNMERIPVETLKKIAAYTKSGGNAIAVGHLPTLTPEGKPLGDAGADTSEIILVPDEASLAQALHNAAKPDFQISATDDASRNTIGFIRRKLANADIYLVVNTSNQPIDTSATFATSHKFAEEWDGDTAVASAASAAAQPIQLVAYGSRVFVFSDTPSAAKSAPTPEKQLADLSNDWKVNFTGLNTSVDEATPTDWTADPSTIHYSGEGIYTRDFTLAAAPAGPVFLEVDGGKATPVPARAAHSYAFYDPPVQAAALVTINGRSAGALWHPPYRLNVSKLLKPGVNHIEIDVYNTALNAWSALPPHDYAPLIAKYGDRFQMQDLNLVAPISSGLLGPVHLVTTETK